jgi:hypothetical protein
MEGTGNVWRRNYEGIRRTVGIRPEISVRSPVLIPLLLDAFWIEALV